MAETKRRAGRPRKDATPAAKKQKTAATSKEQTPVVEVVEKEREPSPLPNKFVETQALPTLSISQPFDLPDDEYQSVGASGVLAASLERSRQRWVSGSFFQKYWTKVSTRKDAPPPPPNNPTRTWMKEIGSCSITVEPLIIEAAVFYVKEPGMAGPVIQTIPAPQQQRQKQVQYQAPPPQLNVQPTAPSPYGTPYRPQQPYQSPAQQQPYYQNRALPPMTQPAQSPMATPDNRILPPIMPAAPLPPHVAVAPRLPAVPAPAPVAAPPPQAKPSPDPVIQMLATRASSDHELKALMKVVATGNANQEQLRIFQRHIDELTAIINRNKAQQPPPPPLPPLQQQPPPMTPSQGMGAYNSNVASRTSTPGVSGPQQILPRPGPVNTPPPPKSQQKHPNQYTAHSSQKHANQYTSHSSQKHVKAQNYAVQPPQKFMPPHLQPVLPIVLEFQGPGASPDRFRFPEYSVLEFLTPYMLLVSFLYIKRDDSSPNDDAKSKSTAKPTENGGESKEEAPEASEDKTKPIYEPITLKITVDETDKGKELLGYIQRCVKPVAEVRTWMTEQITRSTRAEIKFLALRLPHKSQIREGSSDEGATTKEATPSVAEKKKPAPRKSIDNNNNINNKKPKDKDEGEKDKDKPDADAVAEAVPAQEKNALGQSIIPAPTAPSGPSVPATAEQEIQAIQGAAAAAAAASAEPGGSKGRRSTRKSVRIGDVPMSDA